MDIYDMVLTAEFDLITSIESVEDINRLVEWNYDLTKYEFFLLNTDDVEIFDRLIEIGCDATSINDGYTLLESTKNIKIFNRLIDLGCNPFLIYGGYDILKNTDIKIFNRMLELGCNPLTVMYDLDLLATNDLAIFDKMLELGYDFTNEDVCIIIGKASIEKMYRFIDMGIDLSDHDCKSILMEYIDLEKLNLMTKIGYKCEPKYLDTLEKIIISDTPIILEKSKIMNLIETNRITHYFLKNKEIRRAYSNYYNILNDDCMDCIVEFLF